MTQPVERRADEAASGWEEHSRRHSPRRLGRPVANAKPGSILRIEGSTTHTDVLLTRRGGQSCLRTGGIWEISDEVPAQPAARPSGSLSRVVCQPGLHVGALVWRGDGPSRGAMVLVMLEPVALAWILLLPVIAGSVFADAFDWLPGILVIRCVLVAIGESAAVGQNRGQTFRPSADRGRDDCGNGRTTYRHGLARLADRRAAARAAPHWRGASASPPSP